MDRKSLLLNLAMSFLHVPYKWGGDDASGIDCSGFLLELLKSFGLVPGSTDTTAKGLYNFLKGRTGASVLSAADFGNVLFFGANIDSISHVALCIGNGLMIEAGGGGSRTNTVADAIAQNAFVRIRPITNRKDLCRIVTVDWGYA